MLKPLLKNGLYPDTCTCRLGLPGGFRWKTFGDHIVAHMQEEYGESVNV